MADEPGPSEPGPGEPGPGEPGTGEPGTGQPDPAAPPDVDARRANVARVYDYWLGGTRNFQADQDLGRQIMAVEPNVRAIARANRAFLGRAVRVLAEAGIRQFLDIGSGIPTQGNVHEVAQAVDPSVRVVYADIDPVAVAYSQAILSHNPNAAAIQADLRDPPAILADDTIRRLIDFSRPAGLLLVSVLHFIPDADQPRQLVATLRDALAPGSYLVLCHAAEAGPITAQPLEKVYNQSVSASLRIRSGPEIWPFFDGFEVLDPGLVSGPQWRPDPAAVARGEAGHMWGLLAGVGRKP
jgi:SAM-dependent methyltransferase